MNNSPKRYAYYSIGASLLTLGLKFGAYFLTDSVGLLSDATESLVNLTAGILALTALTIAYRPADKDHPFGHGKAEYFSSGAEGVLIIIAAAGILYASILRFKNPVELTALGPGIIMALAASGINWFTAKSMLKAARRFDSITLEADARHLLTDVWTSAGLVLGLSILLLMPEWRILDPVIATIMALNIIRTGLSLLTRSTSGLMDLALPAQEVEIIRKAIFKVAGKDAVFHGLRTRKSGPRRFIDFHLLLPGNTSVQDSHDLCVQIEKELESNFPNPQTTIHVEPLEDKASWDGPLVGGICHKMKGGKE